MPPAINIYNNSGVEDGDVLLLNPNQSAVRKNATEHPTFDKQQGWREWQAEEALDRQNRLRRRRVAWGPVTEDGFGDGRFERGSRLRADPVDEGDLKRR